MTAQDYLQKWIKETYPLMDSADYCELDYYDMQKFAVWIVKLLTTPAVVGRSEQLKCQCEKAQFTRTVDADFNPLCGRCGKAL